MAIEKSIELRIMGGLGNQLYQYAAARSLQKAYSCPEIVINVGEYNTYKTRDLEIDCLLNNPTVRFENRDSLKDSVLRIVFKIYQRIYHDLKKKHAREVVLKIGKKFYMLSTTKYIKPMQLTCDYLYMYGYFVSSKTALSIRKELMTEIKLTKEDKAIYIAYKELFSQNTVIGVSIRCGKDYVDNGWPVCSRIYYVRGIKEVIKKKGYVNPIIAIFADDLAKIKDGSWFSDLENVVFIEGLNVCESFELLRSCKDYVCSNSSFSWWGAFLSYSDNPIIINPNKIFAGSNEMDDAETFYEGMTFLDYVSGEMVDSDVLCQNLPKRERS